MSVKSWLDRRLKNEIQAEQINANDSRAHSNAYHRFFAGYTETKKIKQDGSGYTIERVYTGQYYQRAMGRRKSLLLKALYVAIAVAIIILFLSAASARVQTNSIWYVALCEALSIASLVWMCTGVGNYIFGPKKMTVYEYNSSSVRIKKASLCASIALFVTGSVSALWLGFNAKQAIAFGEIVPCIVKFFASAALTFALNRIENAVKYEKTLSEMSGKINGVVIQ